MHFDIKHFNLSFTGKAKSAGVYMYCIQRYSVCVCAYFTMLYSIFGAICLSMSTIKKHRFPAADNVKCQVKTL